MRHVVNVTGKPGRIRLDPTDEPRETKSDQTEVQALLVRLQGKGWVGQSEQNPDVFN